MTTRMMQHPDLCSASDEDGEICLLMAIFAHRVEFRKVFVPPHRYTPLKERWMEIYTPVFEQMKIDIRMNLKVSVDHN